ncbi:hypothetical protein CLPUN_04560 [Clostridium puniceum]|uniref:Anti-sigma factor RsgI-like middle domain-containing protein n=1 Tax=Clostridium puniceum TaxID=29367 RepID=A0A1S8TX74_9CLOT|nr:hypothetical protein [Clostridium puniceum]OOM82172.1 hypothetical protein CLPUN_04560 [Clostridium puniceum]
MEKVLFKELDNLDIKDTTLLLNEDINLSVDYFTRKNIEKSVMKKSGIYRENNNLIQKINNILGGIFMKRKIAVVLSAAMIFSLAGGGYAYAKNPVAYVSVDINPSVELSVNVFDKVVSVEAYNEDGRNILEGANLVNIKVEDAVSIVISNAISKGYIKEDGSSGIEITTATDKEKVGAELDETLKEVADETLSDNDKEAKVETENVALARRDEARKLGITPGKLNLIQKLQQLDPVITIEDYKDSSVKDIQKKAKELRKDINKDESDSINDENISIHTNNESANIDTNIDTVNEEKNNSSPNNTNNKENNVSKNQKDENINKNQKVEDVANKAENKNNGNTEKSNSSNSQNSSKEKNKNN